MASPERQETDRYVGFVGNACVLFDVDDFFNLGCGRREITSGGANAQKPAKEGPMEAWGRSPANPVGGWPTRSQQ